MKICIIFHNQDLDGQMSAAVVKHWFNKTYTDIKLGISDPDSHLDFIGYNYGQPIPDLSEYDEVIMCDISFPKEEMIKLYEDKDFIWLDHHISAINESKHSAIILSYDDAKGIRDTKFAACELTWQYFFSNEPMPEIVRLLGRYDCFGHKGTSEETKVLEFQYGTRQCISNYEEAYEYLQRELYYNSHIPSEYDIDPIYEIHKQGKAIYQYLCTEAKQSYSTGFEVELKEYKDDMNLNPFDLTKGTNLIRKFICINKERFNPINFGIDYHKDGYDGCACFHYANGMWNFSIYNDNGLVDCSVIAKQFGGGGHFSASGMILNNKQFNNLISSGRAL